MTRCSPAASSLMPCCQRCSGSTALPPWIQPLAPRESRGPGERATADRHFVLGGILVVGFPWAAGSCSQDRGARLGPTLLAAAEHRARRRGYGADQSRLGYPPGDPASSPAALITRSLVSSPFGGLSRAACWYSPAATWPVGAGRSRPDLGLLVIVFTIAFIAYRLDVPKESGGWPRPVYSNMLRHCSPGSAGSHSHPGIYLHAPASSAAPATSTGHEQRDCRWTARHRSRKVCKDPVGHGRLPRNPSWSHFRHRASEKPPSQWFLRMDRGHHPAASKSSAWTSSGTQGAGVAREAQTPPLISAVR